MLHTATVSQYTFIFCAGYATNFTEETFKVTKVQDTIPWTYLLQDSNKEDITGAFYEQELTLT